MSSLPANEMLTDNSAEAIDSSLEGLSWAISNQKLIESHQATIRNGWAMIGVLGDTRDGQAGIQRDISHTDALGLAWSQLAEAEETDETAPYKLCDSMLIKDKKHSRDHLVDLADQAAARDPAISPQAASHLKAALEALSRSDGLSYMVREDLPKKISIFKMSQFSLDADLVQIYKGKLVIRSEGNTTRKSNHPQMMKAANYFEGQTTREIAAFREATGLTEDDSEIRALLGAASFLQLKKVTPKGRQEINRLRMDYFAELMKGQVPQAISILEEMVLLRPDIITPATCDLLGLDKEQIDQLVAYAQQQKETTEAERRAQPTPSEIAAEMARVERDTYGPWLEENAPTLEGKVCEILDEQRRPTGEIIRLHKPRLSGPHYGGRPAITKSNYNVYRTPDGKLVFTHYTANYVRAASLAKMMQDGTIAIYDSVKDYVGRNFPETPDFEEIHEKPLYNTDGLTTERTRRHGHLLISAARYSAKAE